MQSRHPHLVSRVGTQISTSRKTVRHSLRSLVTCHISQAILDIFMLLIRIFISYSGTLKLKYQEFIELKLDSVIRWLKLMVNDQTVLNKVGPRLKSGMSFEDFEKEMKPLEDTDLAKAKGTKFKVEDKGYDIVRIDSYQQLNSEFGGKLTDYKGQSEWCHANGSSTYPEKYKEKITHIVIPDSVTRIGKGAFIHCTSLKSVEIPDSVTSIGAYVFYHCPSIKVTFQNTDYKNMKNYPFGLKPEQMTSGSANESKAIL